MRVGLGTITVTEAQRHDLREREGRGGLATREEVRDAVMRLWGLYVTRGEEPAPPPPPAPPSAAEPEDNRGLWVYTTETLRREVERRTQAGAKP